MSKLGADWSYSPPNLTQLRSLGYGFICRYLSDSGKGITAAEVAAAHALSLDIVLVYETTANRAMSGSGGGANDGVAAKVLAGKLGAPTGTAIYFAVDFDATTTQMATVMAYLAAARASCKSYTGGVYGSYAVVTTALAGGYSAYGWSTYAWSAGKKSGHLHQYSNGQKIAGGVIDLNEALAVDMGAWAPPLATPVDYPLPGTPDVGGASQSGTAQEEDEMKKFVFVGDYNGAVWVADSEMKSKSPFRSMADCRATLSSYAAQGIAVVYVKWSASQWAGIPTVKG